MKILQGAECNVDVVGADSVDHLKELVKVRGINVCHFSYLFPFSFRFS